MRLLTSIVLATALATPAAALAQTASSAFETLRMTRQLDSLRRVVGLQRAELDRVRRITAQPRVTTRLQVDTVVAVQVRVDTVVRFDTVSIRVPAELPPRPDSGVVAPKPAPTAAPARPAVTFAPVQVSGLLQVWGLAGDAGFRQTWRIRRAELKLTSDLGMRAKATVAIDVAKALSASMTSSGATNSVTIAQGSRVLQDAFVTVPFRFVTLDVGQQKLSLGSESIASSAALETVERPLFASDRSRGGGFGDVRDLGTAVRGGIAGRADWQLGVFNGVGEGQNETDRNVGKAVVGRAVMRPVGSVLQFGVSGATAGDPTADKPRRDRLGGEVRIRAGRARLIGEIMGGHDGAISRRGGYVLTGYNVTPTLSVVARADQWDPDLALDNTEATVTERAYLLGATWIPNASRMRLQLAVNRRLTTADVIPPRTQLLTNLQATW